MPERLWISHRLSDLGRHKKDLAAALGLDPARITEIINGTRSVRVDEIAPMARCLEMTEVAVYCQLAGHEIPDGLSPDSINLRKTQNSLLQRACDFRNVFSPAQPLVS